MKFGHSNRTNLPLATQKHGRRGLLNLLASLSPVAIAVALIVAGFALASSGVQLAHADGPPAITTATANGSASPVPGSCLPANSYQNGDFTINQGGNPLGLCGDGIDENTSWTFTFDPKLCDTSDSGSIASAILTLTLTPRDPVFTNDLVIVEGPPSLVPTLPISDSVGNLAAGWILVSRVPLGSPALAVNATSTIKRDLVLDYGQLVKDELNANSSYNPSLGTEQTSLQMRYEDDATISSASLTLTCTPLRPCAVPGGFDISTGSHVAHIQTSNSDLVWTLTSPSGPAHEIGQASTWVTPDPPANWIDPFGTGDDISDTPGDYVYQTSFFVPAAGDRIAVNFQYAADNSVSFALHGPANANPLVLTTPSLPSTGDFQWLALHPAVPTTYISVPVTLAGLYSLTATVHNNTAVSPNNPLGLFNPTGLLVEGTVTCGPPVGGLVALSVSDSGSPISSLPLAATAAGVIAVLAAGAWYGRRRWLR